MDVHTNMERLCFDGYSSREIINAAIKKEPIVLKLGSIPLVSYNSKF